MEVELISCLFTTSPAGHVLEETKLRLTQPSYKAVSITLTQYTYTANPGSARPQLSLESDQWEHQQYNVHEPCQPITGLEISKDKVSDKLKSES